MTRPKLPAQERKDVHVSVRLTAEQADRFRKWLAGDMSALAIEAWQREVQRRAYVKAWGREKQRRERLDAARDRVLSSEANVHVLRALSDVIDEGREHAMVHRVESPSLRFELQFRCLSNTDLGLYVEHACGWREGLDVARQLRTNGWILVPSHRKSTTRKGSLEE